MSAPWPHRTPIGRRAGGRGIPGRKQHLQLVRGQHLLTGARRAWRPPAESPLTKPLVAQPKPLAIVHQRLNRRGAAIAEYEQRAAERVLLERLLAQANEPVDPPAEVNRR